MSQENVKVVQAAFKAWNTGGMDAWADFFAPDVISRSPEGWPEPGPFVGEAVARQETISDFIDVGNRVAVRFIWLGKGHGPDVNLEMTGVYTVSKGRIAFFEFFWDHAEALEALGLLE